MEWNYKILSFGAPNFQAFRAPKFLGTIPACLTYTGVNLRLEMALVNIDFTGPGLALDAPVCILELRHDHTCDETTVVYISIKLIQMSTHVAI